MNHVSIDFAAGRVAGMFMVGCSPASVNPGHCTQICADNACGHADGCGARCTTCPAGQSCDATAWQCQSDSCTGTGTQSCGNCGSQTCGADGLCGNCTGTGTGTVAWSGVSSFSPRLFQPQASPTTVQDVFALPGWLVAGTYGVVVVVRDPHGYRQPMPLAINGAAADGSYHLYDLTVTP